MTRIAEKKGFTLVEVMTTVFFLSLLLLPVTAALVRALIVSNEVEYITVATFLAVQKVEETRARATCYTNDGAGCPVSGNEHDFDQPLNEADCGFPAPYSKYRCIVDYQDSPLANTQNRLGEIRVRVWYDRNDSDTWDTNEPDVFFETMITMRSPAWTIGGAW